MSIFLLSLLGLLQMNDTTEMVFVGDAMQHGPQIRAAARADGSFDYSSCFTLLEDDIRSADFAVANLECPLGGKPYSGYPLFSAPDDYARQLKASGFDLLVTANNHCMDSGKSGALRTVEALDGMGMAHVGTYASADERKERMPLIKDVNGIKTAFLAYTYDTNGLPVVKPVVVDMIDRELIAGDVEKARKAGAELVCVCMHWGNEYEMLPSKSQKSLAGFLREIGVDLIIGSHPHVVQPMEMDYSAGHGTGCATVYSLGNFISNQNDVNSRGGAMARVQITRYEDRPVVTDVLAKLFFCQKPEYGRGNYRLIPQNLNDSVRVDSKRTFEQFVFNARKLFDKYNINID